VTLGGEYKRGEESFRERYTGGLYADRTRRNNPIVSQQVFLKPTQKGKDKMQATGSCLCGKSSYSLDGEPALTVRTPFPITTCSLPSVAGVS
jgi:hypothetical protein